MWGVQQLETLGRLLVGRIKPVPFRPPAHARTTFTWLWLFYCSHYPCGAAGRTCRKINKQGVPMNFLRMHWFDLGLFLAVGVGGFILVTHPTGLTLLLWLNLIALFFHQFEEYRYPGYFPGMMNVVMFSSQQPDRFPLNPQIALIVNVLVGWLFYFLAAILNQKAIWLGIATMLVSTGNFIAHTFLFNLRGRTRYNPGMLVSILFFLPLFVLFFVRVMQQDAASTLDWVLGIVLGVVLNYVGILKMIEWMKDESTRFIFPPRFLLPKQSQTGSGQ
jgi:hypothetical protein